ncbi:MAG: hypothetical protein NTV33_11245 [Coprothermobacterota bacterium]|jgi:hypothetical protein|nr:hypothetical protein [Coprothermobacterota bacterium]
MILKAQEQGSAGKQERSLKVVSFRALHAPAAEFYPEQKAQNARNAWARARFPSMGRLWSASIVKALAGIRFEQTFLAGYAVEAALSAFQERMKCAVIAGEPVRSRAMSFPV